MLPPDRGMDMGPVTCYHFIKFNLYNKVEYHLLSAQHKGSLQDQTQSRQDALLAISMRSYLARCRHVGLLNLSPRASICTTSSKGGPGLRLTNPWCSVI